MKKILICSLLFAAQIQSADAELITRAKKSDSNSPSFLSVESYTPAQIKARLGFLMRCGWQIGKILTGYDLFSCSRLREFEFMDIDFEALDKRLPKSRMIHGATTKVPGAVLCVHGLRGLLREFGFNISEFFSYLEGNTSK